MITVNCDHCRSRFRADEKFAGRKAKCPKCQNTFRLPEAAASTPPPFVPPATGDIVRNVVAVTPPISSETKGVSTSDDASKQQTIASQSTLVRLGLSVAIGVAWLYFGWSLNGLLGLAASGVALVACAFTVWLLHRYGAMQQLSLRSPAGWAVMLFAKPFIVLFGPVGGALLLSWCGGPRKRNSIYTWSTGAQWAILGGVLLVFIGSAELERWLKEIRQDLMQAKGNIPTPTNTASANEDTQTPILSVPTASAPSPAVSPAPSASAPSNVSSTLQSDSKPEDVEFVEKLTALMVKKMNSNLPAELINLEARCRIVANTWSKVLGQPHRTKVTPAEAVDVFLAGYAEMLSRKRPADRESFDRLSRPEKMEAALRVYEQMISEFDINELPAKPATTHNAPPADVKFIDDLTTLLVKKTNPNLPISALDLDARCRMIANTFCKPLGWRRHSTISPTEAIDVFLAGFAVILSQDDPTLGKDFENLSRPEKMQVAKVLFEKAMQELDMDELTTDSSN